VNILLEVKSNITISDYSTFFRGHQTTIEVLFSKLI